MSNINVAEILKYCPKGTKLYSTVYGEINFIEITTSNMIRVELPNNLDGNRAVFYKEGSFYKTGECVLFPSKDQRDWSKFRLPVKKGDIMMSDNRAFIISDEYEITCVGSFHKYICGIADTGAFKVSQSNRHWTSDFYIPASEEAKKELFDKMAEAGYKWNADTLKLEKIEFKFKEGDIISNKLGNLYLVANINNRNVVTAAVLYADGDFIPYNIYHPLELKNFNLASEEERRKFYSILVKEGFKYDKKQHLLIKQKFKPFEKVLARDNETDSWKADIYLKYLNNTYGYKCARTNYVMCIPYEGNEYLLDTTDSPT